MPRAILGKNNYIKYLKDKIVNDQGLVRIKSLGPQKILVFLIFKMLVKIPV